MSLKLGTVFDTGKPFTFPIEAVTQTIGILARKRAGKSNTGVVAAEEMYRNHLPWVAIDPKGDWWGIRSSGDGKGPGLQVPIFGGEHGDVPLEPGSGKFIADLIVDLRLTCVLDVSQMMIENKSACRRFLTDFAKRLYARNREPLHVFCEEADEYIPQMVRGDAAEMVGAFETLVKRGGFHGIGITLITQRSASLNKDVLTQIDTLIALQTTGPQDKDAIEAWIKHHRLATDVISDIADLKKGQAWVFSPSWLEVLVKVKFRKRWTYDSGATPEVGKKLRPPSTLADVDIAKITKEMAATIDRVKAEDPRVLHAKIRDLEKQIAMKERLAVAEPKVIEKRVEVKVPYLDPKLVSEAMGIFTAALNEAGKEILKRAKEAGENERWHKASIEMHREHPSVPKQRLRRLTGRELGEQDLVHKIGSNGSSEISAAGQKILNALGWLESVRIMQPDRTTVGAISGYSARSGHFKNVTGSLRSSGLIEYPNADTLALTDAGRKQAVIPDTPPTTYDLHAALLGKLDTAQQRLLGPLLEAKGDYMTREKLGEISGYSHTSGHFKNVLGSLRSMKVIEYPDAQTVRASDLVFLD